MSLSFGRSHSQQTPAVRNVNDMMDEGRTLGQRAADRVAETMGSWRFIIIQSVLLVVWVALNVTAWVRHWDPYPFILMNLALSMQAAFAAPIIMMSQNRQAVRDRVDAHNDYLINLKAEEEVRLIMDHLERQDRALREVLDLLRAHDAGETPHRAADPHAPREPQPVRDPHDPHAPGRFPGGSAYP